MSFTKNNPGNPSNPNNSIRLGQDSMSQSNSSFTQRDPGFVWQPQAGYLQDLYGMGQQAVQNFAPTMQQGQNIFNTATQGFNQLMNPGVNPQLQAYQGDVQRNLERNILPTVQSNAAGFGQMGSSRQGVAEGLALSDANQQVTDMAANLYSQDMDRMMNTMALAPGLANFGMGLPFYALNQYAGLLGRPTTLQGGMTSTSEGGAESSGWDYMRDIGGGGGGGGGGFTIGTGGLGSAPTRPWYL